MLTRPLKHTPETIRQALFDATTIEPFSGCHLWTRFLNNTGYGIITIAMKCRKAHRVSYEMAKGPIPDGMHLDHLCRTPSCVNPNHLEPVTCRENVWRGLRARLGPDWKPPFTRGPFTRVLKTHCVNGHEFTKENTCAFRGYRLCRACRSETGRRLYQKKKAEGPMTTHSA